MITLFYVAGAVAVIATLLAITCRHAVHALLYLIVSLLAASVIFFILGAPFVAALEVLIYAGAIMVLFVFVVMMLNQGEHAMEVERSFLRPRDWIGPSVLSLLLVGELIHAALAADGGTAPVYAVGPKEVGTALFGSFWVGVELASLLLTAGLVGAYHLGRPPLRKEESLRVTIVDSARIDTGRDPVRPGSDGTAHQTEPDLHVDVH